MSTATFTPDILVSGKSLDVGDVAQVDILTTSGGTLENPTTLVVKVQTPSGTVTTYTYGTDSELTRSATGTHQLLHPLTAQGTHQVRAITTGKAGAEPGSFFVRPNNIIE